MLESPGATTRDDGDIDPRSLAVVVAVSGLMVLAIGAGMLLTGSGEITAVPAPDPGARVTPASTPSQRAPAVTVVPPVEAPAAVIVPVPTPVAPQVYPPSPVAPPRVDFDIPPVE